MLPAHTHPTTHTAATTPAPFKVHLTREGIHGYLPLFSPTQDPQVGDWVMVTPMRRAALLDPLIALWEGQADSSSSGGDGQPGGSSSSGKTATSATAMRYSLAAFFGEPTAPSTPSSLLEGVGADLGDGGGYLNDETQRETNAQQLLFFPPLPEEAEGFIRTDEDADHGHHQHVGKEAPEQPMFVPLHQVTFPPLSVMRSALSKRKRRSSSGTSQRSVLLFLHLRLGLLTTSAPAEFGGSGELLILLGQQPAAVSGGTEPPHGTAAPTGARGRRRRRQQDSTRGGVGGEEREQPFPAAAFSSTHAILIWQTSVGRSGPPVKVKLLPASHHHLQDSAAVGTERVPREWWIDVEKKAEREWELWNRRRAAIHHCPEQRRQDTSPGSAAPAGQGDDGTHCPVMQGGLKRKRPGSSPAGDAEEVGQMKPVPRRVAPRRDSSEGYIPAPFPSSEKERRK